MASSDLLPLALESLSLKPALPKLSKATTQASEVSGYAAFLDLLIRNHIPVFPEKTVFMDNVRRLGKGLSFTVLTGTLKEDLDPADFLCNDIMGEHRKKYAVGENVVAKHLNFQKFTEGPINSEVVLEPIATEALILSHPRMMMCNTIPTLIGVGSEISPFDETESPQHWPFLLTDFGTGGSLEDVFRDAWRKQAPLTKAHEPAVGQLEANPSATWKFSMSWLAKIAMASSVANGLMFLHSIGVVHGDVKFSNCLWEDEKATEESSQDDSKYNDKDKPQGWIIKLCDFGSSVLLSDYQKDSFCKLKAHTPPWDAPESQTEIKQEDMFKTDIYSFGLLLARILLDGNDPFDETFNIAEGRKPNHDLELVQRLKTSGTLVDIITNRVVEQGEYSKVQLALIETLLVSTLHPDPSKRIASMQPISNLLKGLSEGAPLEANITLQGCEEDDDGLFDPERWVRRQSGGYAINYAAGISGIPNLLEEEYRDVTTAGVLMREVFQDLFSKARKIMQRGVPSESTSTEAETLFQVANCYFHGWGVARSIELALQYLETAAIYGSGKAAAYVLPVYQAYCRDLSFESRSRIVDVLQKAFLSTNNRIFGETLKELDSSQFHKSLSLARQYFTDFGQRHIRALTLPLENHVSLPKDLDKAFARGAEIDHLGLFSGMHPIHYAGASGDLTRIRQILSSGTVDIDLRNSQGQTTLYLACTQGHYELVKYLLKERADPRIPDLVDGLTPLYFLSRFEQGKVREIGNLLISHGANINSTPPEGPSALAFQIDPERNFVSPGRLEAVSFLLQNSHSVLEDPSRPHPLQVAALSLDEESVKLLLDHMQKRRIRTWFGGETSLERLRNLKMSCLAPLIKQPAILGVAIAGRNFEAKLEEILGLLATPDVHDAMLEVFDRDPLMLACESRAQHIVRALAHKKLGLEPGIHNGQVLFKAFIHCDIPLVEELLNAGASLNITDFFGGNFLHWAVMTDWDVKSLQYICQLAQKDCDLMGMTTVLWQGGRPFDLAVMQGRLHLANFLMPFTTDINSAHMDLVPSELHEALGTHYMTLLGACLVKLDAGTEKTRIVRYILQTNPDFIVSPDDGMTAIQAAVLRSWADQPRNFFAPESHDPFGDSCDVLKSILEQFQGCTFINKTSDLGLTALHMAAAAGNTPAIEILIDKGANVNSRDNGGDTPLDAVGNKIYRLVSSAEENNFYSEGLGDLAINSGIELFHYAEIAEVLKAHGGLSNMELGPMYGTGELDEEQRERRKQAEEEFRLRKEVLESVSLAAKVAPLNEPGQPRRIVALPPEVRRDLGIMPFKLICRPETPPQRSLSSDHTSSFASTREGQVGKATRTESKASEEEQGGSIRYEEQRKRHTFTDCNIM